MLMASGDFTTLNELFLQAVEKHDKPGCFLFKTGGRYQGLSSKEALNKVAALASVLGRLGVSRGDCVAVLSENRVEWALTDYALLGLGAISVPIYSTLLEPDVEYILRDSGAKGIVVATEPQLQKIGNVRSRLPELKFVLAMDCARLDGTGAECWEGSLALELGSATGLVESFREKARLTRPEDIASILYTSGTTGTPKGVMLTHGNIASNLNYSLAEIPAGPEDSCISFLPLSHITARHLDYALFAKGATVAYCPKFDTLPRAMAQARELAEGPQVSMRLLKRSIYNAAEQSWAMALDDIAAKTAISDHHADAREGLAAFQQKRKPKFNAWLEGK